MGNCLDIPPPPKKQPVYYAKAKPRYYMSTPPSLVPSINGSVRSVPSMYGPYPPPNIAIDPVTGQPYYPMAPTVGPVMMPSPYYSEPPPFYANGYGYGYGYYGSTEEKRASHHHRKHEKKHRKSSRNGDVKDRNDNTSNKNRNSTVITTYPDPQDDVIKRGDQVLLSTSNSAPIGSVETHADNKVTTRPVIATTTDSRGDINQVHLIQSAPTTDSPKGSTYVTYIEDEPPPPEPEQKEESDHEAGEEIETTEEVTETQTITQGGFIETGDPDEDIVQIFIDQPPSSSAYTVSRADTDFRSSKSYRKIESLIQPDSYVPRDVVICCGEKDIHYAMRLKSELQAVRMSAWVSCPMAENIDSDFFSTGQPVLDAKLMVVLLSMSSLQSKHIKYEVSLAHISDTSIFPVAVDSPFEISNSMSVELKLQLEDYKWTELGDHPDISFGFLTKNMMEELKIFKNHEVIDEFFGEVSTSAHRRTNVIRQRSLVRSVGQGTNTTAAQYWSSSFGDSENSVEWGRFIQQFRKDYRELLNSSVPKSCTPYLIDRLKKELEVDSDEMVHKGNFIEFCSNLGTDQDVWEQVRHTAKETQAIRDVFNVESTVRLVAFENIGKLHSTGVVDALRELLNDEDANIREAAIRSLSHCMLSRDEETMSCLIATLDDPDSLVREAGCEAMGHLQVMDAKDKLMTVWSDDVIARVREAAAVALQQLGGTDIDVEMEATKILAEEMDTLL